MHHVMSASSSSPVAIHLQDGLLPDTDPEIEELRAASIAAANKVIRDHLQEHLSRNPGTSYIQWIAALHPENVELDSRLLNEGNPWLTVWHEATAGGHRLSCTRLKLCPGDSHTGPGRCIGGLIDTTVGILLVVVAVIVTFVTECLRGLFLGLALLCSSLIQRLPHSWKPISEPLLTIMSMPAGFFGLLRLIFWITDVLVLVVSVVLAEIVASITAILCGLLSLSPAYAKWTYAQSKKAVRATRSAVHQAFFRCLDEKPAPSPNGFTSRSAEPPRHSGSAEEMSAELEAGSVTLPSCPCCGKLLKLSSAQEVWTCQNYIMCLSTYGNSAMSRWCCQDCSNNVCFKCLPVGNS